MRVLIAEDDDRLRNLLDQALTEAGWDVETVADGTTAYTRALPGGVPYDVLLLDWMLPGLDGVMVCRRLREAGVPTPVLVLTARSQLPDRVSGLDAGADDYLASRSSSTSSWPVCGRCTAGPPRTPVVRSRSTACGSTPPRTG